MLAALKKETADSHAQLVVLSIPEQIALLPNPVGTTRFGAGSAAPEGLNAAQPSDKHMEIANFLGIPTLDLLPVLKDYANRRRLPPPYFSFACDGHWNPLGHKIAAAAMADFLLGQGLISGTKADLQETLNASPEALLGKEAFSQIYGGGIYVSKTGAE